MPAETQNHALLLFRVGPVLCCAPSLPIQSIIEPRPLTRTPGASDAKPGMFRHAGHIVSVLDLRARFGVEETARTQPGRIIVVTLAAGYFGLHVDEIIEVINQPATGWGALPPLLPRGVFTRTLLWQDKIWLYAEFDALRSLERDGYLHQYIMHLQQASASNVADRQPDVHITTTREQQPHAISTGNTTKRTAHTHPVTRPAGTGHAPMDKPAAKGIQTKASDVPQHTPRSRPAATPENITRPTHNPLSQKISQTAHTGGVSSTFESRNKTQQRTHVGITNTPVSTPSVNHAGLSVTSGRPGKTVPQQTVPSGSMASVFAVLLLFGALVAGVGYGTWYLVTPADNPRTSSQSAFIQPNNTAIVALSANIPAHRKPEAQPPSASVIHTRVDALPTDSLQETSPARSEPSAVDIDNSLPESDGALQASIERSTDGITITVEVPDDDPIFRTEALPAVNVAIGHTDETATASGDIDSGMQGRTMNEAQSGQETIAHATPNPSASASNIHSVEIIHIVAKGDTLWHIAKRYVENPYRYPELARLSNIRNPDLIYPGDRVRILKRKRKTRL